MTTPRRDTNGQTPFGAWVQSHPDLDAHKHGLTLTDADMIFHRFMTSIDTMGRRDVQLQMWVEVKTFGKKPTPSQRETLFDHHQRLTTQGKSVMLRTPTGRRRQVWHFGVCFLVLSGDVPRDGGIIWGIFQEDGSIMPCRLSEQTLIKVLRFDNRPDQPKCRLSLRRHHGTKHAEFEETTEIGIVTPRRLVLRS